MVGDTRTHRIIIPFPARAVSPTAGERAAFLRGVEHARAMARKRPIVLWFHERPQRSGRATFIAILILILIVAAAVAHARLTGAVA